MTIFIANESKREITLIKVSDWNSFRANQIYSEICFRANPNYFESIRKKFSISFDVIRWKLVDDFIWMWVNNLSSALCLWKLSLSILKRETLFLYMISLFAKTLSSTVNKLFLLVRKFSLYISPYIYSHLGACAHDLRFAPPKSSFRRHLIFNCFDSCSIDVLMFSYVVHIQGVIQTPNTVYVIECGKFTRVECRMAKGRN